VSYGVLKYNLAPAPSNDVGFYKLRNYMVEVPLINIASKMARFQDGTPAF
jgi:hypothetical protein